MFSPPTSSSYRAFLKNRSTKAHLFAKFQLVMWNPLKGRRRDSSYRKLTSDDVRPYVLGDELPSYEEFESHDVMGEVLRQQNTPHRLDRGFNYGDLDGHITLVEMLRESQDSQCSTVRWQMWSFLEAQMNEITARRIRLEQEFQTVTEQLDAVRQQNEAETELDDLLHFHVNADQVLARDIEAAQRRAGRQERGNKQRTLRNRRRYTTLMPYSLEE
ncbi:MAG: hypothetical protein Q9178_007820 [Gyalolechia marmorata]